MNYLIKSIILIVLFAFPASMFASNAPGTSMDSPCFMTMLKVTQTGTGTANADWFSSIDGPYHIDVVDLETNQVVYKNDTFDNFDTIIGLNANTLYQVTVNDSDNALVFNIFIL